MSELKHTMLPSYTSSQRGVLMFDLDVPGMLERLRKIKEAVLLLSNPSIEYMNFQNLE